ncbi:BlaI/MecI/CopY family transcriptional regulator [Candidatus Wolfebacteria bacterium]|nr:BlaI/MecI/CopY family transcriptional regulator [Candidatus Wolfebacteria bacterium]
MQQTNSAIKALGLSDMEAEVYLAALELGEGTMQALAKKSGVNRSTIYTFIDELKERGFITETKRGKRRLYVATNPERLVQMQKVRTGELERALPELLAIHNSARNKPRVTFYEGVEGIKEIHADMLTAEQEIQAYEDLEGLKNNLPASFFEQFPKERMRRGILYRSISRDSETARVFVKNNIGFLRETKLIITEPLNIEVSIYGDKVALMSLTSNPPFGVLIQDKNIAQVQRIMWQELWNRLGEKIG